MYFIPCWIPTPRTILALNRHLINICWTTTWIRRSKIFVEFLQLNVHLRYWKGKTIRSVWKKENLMVKKPHSRPVRLEHWPLFNSLTWSSNRGLSRLPSLPSGLGRLPFYLQQARACCGFSLPVVCPLTHGAAKMKSKHSIKGKNWGRGADFPCGPDIFPWRWAHLRGSSLYLPALPQGCALRNGLETTRPEDFGVLLWCSNFFEKKWEV